jgi:hypothetical protein
MLPPALVAFTIYMGNSKIQMSKKDVASRRNVIIGGTKNPTQLTLLLIE